MKDTLASYQLKSCGGGLLACFAGLGWLLPSRFYPWTGFHQDAWIALSSLICGGVILFISSRTWHLPRIGCVFIALAFVPVAQWISGQIVFVGAAGISLAYVLGLAAVVVFATCAEEIDPYYLLDRLFFAIGFAAIVTVWIQLYQWLGMVSTDDWWAAGVDAARPSGNFSQPNHAATFLMWGLCAAAWGCWRRHIGWACAMLLAMYLLFGLTLTASRTAWVGIATVVAAVFWWRNLWKVRSVPWIVFGLAGYFYAIRLYLEHSGSMATGLLSDSSVNQRLVIWQVTLDALQLKPWWGYGWDQVYQAQLQVADRPSGLDDIFVSSHNLFLDIFLFMGIPLGIVFVSYLVFWVLKVFGRIKNGNQAILFLFLIPIAVHSMVEYPLQYAHLLLPTGWVIGSLNAKVFDKSQNLFVVPRVGVAAFYLLISALLVIIFVDYGKIEEASRNLRSQVAKNSSFRSAVPEVMLLDHLSNQLKVMLIPELDTELTAAQLDMIEGVVLMPSSKYLLLKSAKLLAINHRTEKATWILRRYCGVVSELRCMNSRDSWNRLAKTESEIALIPWTSESVPVPPH